MRLLWRLAIRNWAARPGRTAVAIGAIALGVALVVAVTSCYESVRVSLAEWVQSWLSRGQLRVQEVPGREVRVEESGVDEALVARIRALPGVKVVAPRFRYWLEFGDKTDTGGLRGPLMGGAGEGRIGVMCTGIDPAAEYQVRGFRLAQGRLLTGADERGALLGQSAADALNIRPGDQFAALDRAKKVHLLTLVGTVVEPRLGVFRHPDCYVLLPMFQSLVFVPQRVQTMDIGLERWASLDQVQAEIEGLLPEGVTAVTTPSSVQPIDEGMRLLGVILVWTSMGALMTAWFMIFATLDLGVVQRTRELGMLRCVGATRGQIAGSVFMESMPLAVVGVVIGLPLGVGIARLAATWFGTVFGEFALSRSGLWLGALGGLGATALAAAAPAANAARLSAIAATRPEAKPARAWLRLPLALGGALLLGTLAWLVWGWQPSAEAPTRSSSRRLAALVIAAWPVGLLAAMAILPLTIAGLGRLLRRPAAVLLRLPHRLLGVQFGRTPWRSALVACALAFGVSLVVNLLTNTESIIAGWELPRTFPDAAVLWPPPLRGVGDEGLVRLSGTPGIGAVAPVAVVDASLASAERGRSPASVRFLGVDPGVAQKMIQLNFIEGTAEEAFATLQRGGAVIVPRQFRREHGLGYGSDLTVDLGRGRTAAFRVVGVVESAGLDLVENYYDVGGAFQAVSATAVVGSLADAQRRLGASTYRLVLFNFNLPETLSDADRTRQEQAILANVQMTTLAPLVVTMAELKGLIDEDFRRAVLWVAFAAGVACLVAGLGVVNLMMANVAARARQIAVLRGVGATKGMVCRLIVGEGLILGLIGAGLGLLHGLFMAAMSNHLDRLAFAIEPKFVVPWGPVGAGVGLAVLVAVGASLIPGIHAGRTNVADALDTA
jgi:putative ABC transport system permease protein